MNVRERILQATIKKIVTTSRYTPETERPPVHHRIAQVDALAKRIFKSRRTCNRRINISHRRWRRIRLTCRRARVQISSVPNCSLIETSPILSLLTLRNRGQESVLSNVSLSATYRCGTRPPPPDRFAFDATNSITSFRQSRKATIAKSKRRFCSSFVTWNSEVPYLSSRDQYRSERERAVSDSQLPNDSVRNPFDLRERSDRYQLVPTTTRISSASCARMRRKGKIRWRN